MIERNISFPGFVSAVYPLINTENSGNLFLGQIPILSQITQSW